MAQPVDEPSLPNQEPDTSATLRSLSKLLRVVQTPVEQQQPAPNASTSASDEGRQAHSLDPKTLAAHIDRIERASQTLMQLAEQARHFEEHAWTLEGQVNDLRKRETNLEFQLQEASRHASRLEGDLQAEKDRASRIEASLSAAMQRIHANEQELTEAHGNLRTLTTALDRTFGNLGDLSDAGPQSVA